MTGNNDPVKKCCFYGLMKAVLSVRAIGIANPYLSYEMDPQAGFNENFGAFQVATACIIIRPRVAYTP